MQQSLRFIFDTFLSHKTRMGSYGGIDVNMPVFGFGYMVVVFITVITGAQNKSRLSRLGRIDRNLKKKSQAPDGKEEGGCHLLGSPRFNKSGCSYLFAFKDFTASADDHFFHWYLDSGHFHAPFDYHWQA